MRILSIETSCDETSIAIFDVFEKEKNLNFKILSHLVHSQASLHAQYGGVFPKMAKREHGKNMIPLFIQSLIDAEMLKKNTLKKNELNTTPLEREPELKESLENFLREYDLPKFDLIIVTEGPGLEPTLWVGINFAKFLSLATNTPLIGANHMEGHIVSVFPTNEKVFSIPKLNFPLLSLLVSGGHTELVLIENWGEYQKIGQTRDDAVGEAFDKVARLLGLSYPGGPEVSKQASLARQNNIKPPFTLPRPMIHSKDFDFSFSGIKTAVLYGMKDKIFSEKEKAAIAKEFEDAVTEVLIKKTVDATLKYGTQTLIIGGGVSANTYIKEQFKKVNDEKNLGLTILTPQKTMTGDNALMIGIAGAMKYYKSKKIEDLDLIKASGNLSL